MVLRHPASRAICAVVVMFAQSAGAQTTLPRTLISGCNGGSTRFTQEMLEFGPAPFFTPLADLTSTVPGLCDDDVMFTHGNYWRLPADTRVSQFYDTLLAGDQGGITQVVSPDSFTIHWPDTDNRGVLAATWTAAVECCGRRCGAVVHEWTLQNISTAPVTIEFYAYMDLDYGASTSNDTGPLSTFDRHMVRQSDLVPTPCSGIAEFHGTPAPDHWEARNWPALEAKFLAPTFVPLSNAALPLANVDYEGAFGWTRTIPPGQSVTLEYRVGHNCLACDQPASTTNYGAAHGAATITSNTLPAPGCPLEIETTGPANAAAAMLIGFAANLPLPGCPQVLLIDPAIATISAVIDSTGMLQWDIPAAGNPSFCGMAFSFQMFALSAGEPCIPIVHTDGLTFRYGN